MHLQTVRNTSLINIINYFHQPLLMTLYRKFLAQVKVFTCILTLIMLIISLTIELFFYENGIEQEYFSWSLRSEMNAGFESFVFTTDLGRC